MSMMCFADPSYLFNFFDDGFILQTIRDPRAWYASMKAHFKAPDNERRFLTFSLALWFESTVRGLIHAASYPDQYLVLRYEDLVCTPEQTLKKIVSKIGIDFETVLLKPTIGEAAWYGNSAYGRKEKLDAASLNHWKNRLTEEEKDYISFEYGEFSGLLGYSDCDPESFGILPGEWFSSELGMSVTLENQSYLEKIKEENRRLNSMLYNVHRGFALDFRRREKATRRFGFLNRFFSSQTN
jgi:hypothetical protein